MDNVGIKEAISRSKERKRALFNHQKVHSWVHLEKEIKIENRAVGVHPFLNYYLGPQ